MSFEILIILLLMLFNAVFAMSEMAIVSSRKARLQEMANKGDAKARVALDLANSPNRFLSTVQIGITLIGILAGAFGGANLAQSIADQVERIPALQDYSEAIGFWLVVILITYLSLIIGELAPKRLALNNPERIAAIVAVPMQCLAKIASPVVHLLSLSTELVLRILQINLSADEPLVTEEEIKLLLQQGAEAGMFEAAEQDMVERVFRLDDQKVNALMTPRPDIAWLDISDSIEINRRKMIDIPHTRFPVCQENLDNVLGIVHVTNVLSQSLKGQPIDLLSLLQSPLIIPETTHALKVLELFKQSGTHIALVVDEYGVIQGLVTLNDVMEVLIGDIPFADQPQETDIVQRDDGSWLVDGMIPIAKLKELLNTEQLPREDRGNFQTLGGFVVTQFGHIPRASDHFEWNGYRFEVMDMDGNRVDKVLITPLKSH
jgi:putative hemolysin